MENYRDQILKAASEILSDKPESPKPEKKAKVYEGNVIEKEAAMIVDEIEKMAEEQLGEKAIDILGLASIIKEDPEDIEGEEEKKEIEKEEEEKEEEEEDAKVASDYLYQAIAIEKEALDALAVEVEQRADLVRLLHALGHHVELKRVGQGDDRLDDLHVFRIGLHARDE